MNEVQTLNIYSKDFESSRDLAYLQ